jgi:hypothetical protein
MLKDNLVRVVNLAAPERRSGVGEKLYVQSKL